MTCAVQAEEDMTFGAGSVDRNFVINQVPGVEEGGPLEGFVLGAKLGEGVRLWLLGCRCLFLGHKRPGREEAWRHGHGRLLLLY